MILKAYVVVPYLEGSQEVHVYPEAESAREAIRAHGRPGEWIVLKGTVWSATGLSEITELEESS